jgi:hypothetical protein
MRVDPYYAVALASAGEHHHKPLVTTSQQRKKKRKSDEEPTEEPPTPQAAHGSSEGVAPTTSRKKTSLKAESSTATPVSTDGAVVEAQPPDDLVDVDYDVDNTDATHNLVAALQRATTRSTFDNSPASTVSPTLKTNCHHYQCAIARLQCLVAAVHTCNMMVTGATVNNKSACALATTTLVHIGRVLRTGVPLHSASFSDPVQYNVPFIMNLIRMGGRMVSMLLGGGTSTTTIPISIEGAVGVSGYWSSLLVHLHRTILQVGMALMEEVDAKQHRYTDGTTTSSTSKSSTNTIQLAECIILLREVSEGQASLALLIYSVMRRMSTTVTNTSGTNNIHVAAPGSLRRAAPLESHLLSKWWRHAAATCSHPSRRASKDGECRGVLSLLSKAVGSKRPRANIITISDDDDENISAGSRKPHTVGKRVDTTSLSGNISGTDLATSLYASGFIM